MVQVPVHSMEGEVVDHIDVSDTVFGMPANPALVHQAVVRQLADARQGTVKTKSRGEVSGGGRKLFRQKGTGFARRGSRRAPLLRGGGVVFGPRPREYRQALPKKMRRLALRHSLSAKVADEDIIVVDRLAFDAPKTREMVRVLANLGVDASALVVIP
ncbi:MAG: 50S ribosomal protein L4, partial [Chloroflexota bacterium]